MIAGARRLSDTLVQALGSQLRGPLLVPGGPGYDDARSIWNGMHDRRPALIARCLDVADVTACVNLARENGIALSIKGGGHNIAGLAVCDGALMLDLSLMRAVWVDPATRTARAQTGCLLGDVDRETQAHGLAAALGFVSSTGIAGLTLGGGFGYLARRFGWSCDNVLSMDVVTANGRAVRASESENRDLLWALRGGGGNFGVITSIEYQLHDIGPDVTGGAIAWPASDARKVLEMVRSLVRGAPPELTFVVVMRPAPSVPWLPQEVHGKAVITLLLCHSGRPEDGDRLVAPIKAFGSPVGDIVQRRSWVSQQSFLDATQPKGRRYYWKSEYLYGLEPELLEKVLEHAGRIVSPHSAIFLFQVDGALNRLPADHSAAGNRDAAFVLNITAGWDNAVDDAANIEWARAAWRDLRQFSTGGTYVNFLTEEEGEERIRAAYGPNHARLVDIKTQWDPQNLFRMNKNIAPR